MRRIRAETAHLRRQLGVSESFDEPPAGPGVLLALAYPDRIAQRRPGARGRFLLRNGRGAALESSQPLADAEYLAIAAVDDRQAEGRIFLAARITAEEIEEHFAAQIVHEDFVAWDDSTQRVVAQRQRRLGAIILTDVPLREPDPILVADALVAALAKSRVSNLPWSESAKQLRQRLAFLHRVDGKWPDVSDAHLESVIHAWLAPRVVGMRSREEVGRLDLAAALLGLLTWEQRAALDGLAPTHLVAPTGSRLPIDYANAEAPVLAVRLQEMFGLADTPRIAGSRVPLTLHLLSPAQRPLQVTQDLAGFWRTSYFDVKKEMRGRYPKHFWPDDPLTAAPTSRVKPKR
jgi:ATP-dependent helicase HrpB